ncbi:hypothetical protein ACWDXD_25005 [Streptomyces sp. NPDC003314]
MSKSPQRLDIIVDKALPVVAVKRTVDGVETLFLQPQVFESAVEHVRSVLPGISVKAAEDMLREQCPEFRSFDELIGPPELPTPRVNCLPPDPTGDVAPRKPLLPRRRRRQAVLVAALLPALVGSWALGRYTDIIDPRPAPASAPDITSASRPGTAPVPAPFDDLRFEDFTGSSRISCNPISTLAAECTDADGMVMSTKAATGPDSTIFTFSYGSERIGLRVFYDAGYAGTWSTQDGSREMYPNLKVHGRYALWGTDVKRIGEYVDLLEDADRDRHRGPAAASMGGAAPLPPRLAALTLGTLGLTRHEVLQIIDRPESAVADGPTVVAARLVLGLGTVLGGGAPVGDDIVALAAGLGKPRSSSVVQSPVVSAERTLGPSPTVPSIPETGPVLPVPTASEPTPSPVPPPTPVSPAPTPSPSQPPPVVSPPPPVTSPPPTSPPPVTPPPVVSPPPVVEVPGTPEPVPTEPEAPVPPETEEPVPVPEEPAPVEEVPAPAPDPQTPGEDEDADGDLLIVDSAWTVAAG